MMTSKNTVKINGEKLKNLLKIHGAKSFADASRTIGFSGNYITNSISRGTVTKAATILIEKTYGIKLEDYKLEEKKKEEKQYSIEPYPDGYRLDLMVKPDKVKVSLSFGEEEIQEAWAEVRGDTELDLLKAISYASHMMYKFAEQKKLEG